MSNINDFLSEEKMNEIVLKMISDKKEKQEKLSSFIKSTLFTKIVATILEKNIFLDEEDFRYFPEKVLENFSIKELNQESLNLFIDCMIDDELLTPQKTFIEEKNPFENSTSEKLGLNVFLMWGQGCCIQIFPASINRRGE
jgi:hypothetical protein